MNRLLSFILTFVVSLLLTSELSEPTLSGASAPPSSDERAVSLERVRSSAQYDLMRDDDRQGLFANFGRHFKERCKDAARFLRDVWEEVETMAHHNAPDGLLSVNDARETIHRGRLALREMRNRLRYYEWHHPLASRAESERAVWRSWRNQRFTNRINLGRAMEAFVDGGEFNRQGRTLETALHHNAPDEQASYGDVNWYIGHVQGCVW